MDDSKDFNSSTTMSETEFVDENLLKSNEDNKKVLNETEYIDINQLITVENSHAFSSDAAMSETESMDENFVTVDRLNKYTTLSSTGVIDENDGKIEDITDSSVSETESVNENLQYSSFINTTDEDINETVIEVNSFSENATCVEHSDMAGKNDLPDFNQNNQDTTVNISDDNNNNTVIEVNSGFKNKASDDKCPVAGKRKRSLSDNDQDYFPKCLKLNPPHYSDDEAISPIGLTLTSADERKSSVEMALETPIISSKFRKSCDTNDIANSTPISHRKNIFFKGSARKSIFSYDFYADDSKTPNCTDIGDETKEDLVNEITQLCKKDDKVPTDEVQEAINVDSHVSHIDISLFARGTISDEDSCQEKVPIMETTIERIARFKNIDTTISKIDVEKEEMTEDILGLENMIVEDEYQTDTEAVFDKDGDTHGDNDRTLLAEDKDILSDGDTPTQKSGKAQDAINVIANKKMGDSDHYKPRIVQINKDTNRGSTEKLKVIENKDKGKRTIVLKSSNDTSEKKSKKNETESRDITVRDKGINMKDSECKHGIDKITNALKTKPIDNMKKDVENNTGKDTIIVEIKIDTANNVDSRIPSQAMKDTTQKEGVKVSVTKNEKGEIATKVVHIKKEREKNIALENKTKEENKTNQKTKVLDSNHKRDKDMKASVDKENMNKCEKDTKTTTEDRKTSTIKDTKNKDNQNIEKKAAWLMAAKDLKVEVGADGRNVDKSENVIAGKTQTQDAVDASDVKLEDTNELMTMVRKRWNSDGIPDPEKNLTSATSFYSQHTSHGVLEGEKLCCVNLYEDEINTQSKKRSKNRRRSLKKKVNTEGYSLERLYLQIKGIEDSSCATLRKMRNTFQNKKHQLIQKHQNQVIDLKYRQNQEIRRLKSSHYLMPHVKQQRMMQMNYEHQTQAYQLRNWHKQEMNAIQDQLHLSLQRETEKCAALTNSIRELIGQLESVRENEPKSGGKYGPMTMVMMKKAACKETWWKKSSVNVCLPAAVAQACLLEDDVFDHFYKY